MYDTQRHGIPIDNLSLTDMVDICVKTISKELKDKRQLKVMSYDSLPIGLEFVEYWQTIRVGGAFATMLPGNDLATVVVDAGSRRCAIVMHDPRYRHTFNDVVIELNRHYGMDFFLDYRRKMDTSRPYFSRS